VHQSSTKRVKGQAHCVRHKKEDLLSAPCACCACASAHPSAEVYFALPRQFSIFVSSIVTVVVFRGLILTVTKCHHTHYCVFDYPCLSQLCKGHRLVSTLSCWLCRNLFLLLPCPLWWRPSCLRMEGALPATHKSSQSSQPSPYASDTALTVPVSSKGGPSGL
jgi:hypothetical protein